MTSKPSSKTSSVVKKAAPASFFSDHERKKVIRQLWCKPQLNLLHASLKKKLIYIGLPDIEALDVLEWLEHLDKVIAFQCSNYGGETVDVAKLDTILNTLEEQSKLRTSVVYQGWMEDIIMGGLSERGQTYSQSDFLKVYNLDFCNNLTVPREVKNEKGKVVKIISKIDAIDKLLEYQNTQGQAAKGEKFLMYLTINSNTFHGSMDDIKDKAFDAYKKKIKTITKPEVLAVRQMKAYCFSELSKIFHKRDFHVEFLPPIFYLGMGYYPNRDQAKKVNHRMMTFTIMGTQKKHGETLYAQDINDFLDKKFMFANDKTMSCYKDNYIEEIDYSPDVLQIIKSSYTYKNLWKF